MTREDKQSVISICRILADKMDDSGKVAVEQVISAVRDLEEQLPEQEPVFYPQVEGITPTVVRQEPTIEAYKQVCKERDIAIEQLHELGYEWGQKIEPRDDAISRQAALESIKNLYPDMPVMDYIVARRKWLEKYASYFECENVVEHLPSVRPQEPKTGHWKRVSIDKYVQHAMAFYRCSECDKDIIGEHNYCPNCGARMESEEQA